MIAPTSIRFARHVAYAMFTFVIGDDECGMSRRSIDVRRSGAGSRSPDELVGGVRRGGRHLKGTVAVRTLRST